VPVLLYKLYGARTILNTIIQSLTPHNNMLNMSLVKHSVTLAIINEHLLHIVQTGVNNYPLRGIFHLFFFIYCYR